MTSSLFKLTISATHADPTVKCIIKFDGAEINTFYCMQTPVTTLHNFDDLHGAHLLEIIMSDKNELSNNEVMLHVDKFELDHVDITKFFWWHGFNYRHELDNDDKFSEYIGVNGTVEFPFSSPTYEWLEQNYKWYI